MGPLPHNIYLVLLQLYVSVLRAKMPTMHRERERERERERDENAYLLATAGTARLTPRGKPQ
jgi:hypothetical protein